MIKKLFPRVLALALILALIGCAALSDGDMAALIESYGLEPVNVDGNPTILTCYFKMVKSGVASVTWSDGAQMYAVKGDYESMARLYVDALALGGWERCRFSVDDSVLYSFGVKSEKQVDTLEEYVSDVMPELDALIGAQAPAPTADAGQDYVLNTSSKKFHYPGCSSVGKMKAKNRKDYHGSRDDLIAQGYKPCGNCNP